MSVEAAGQPKGQAEALIVGQVGSQAIVGARIRDRDR
jgi:hypothetical protein